MSFDRAKDQTLCAPAYLAVGKPDCQCCSFYIRTSRPAGRIDAASRSEKAMEIQAKRQGLLPSVFYEKSNLLGSAPRKHPLPEVGAALPDFLWLFHSPFGRLRAAPPPKAFGAGPPIARASAPDLVKLGF
jgi:hypothetical protein